MNIVGAIKSALGLSPEKQEFDLVKLNAEYTEEMALSDKAAEKFHKAGKDVIEAYLGKKRDSLPAGVTKTNLFHSNIQTVRSMLYGKIPKVDVSRRYSDANDDAGRAAAEVLQRVLNNDIQASGFEIPDVLRSNLDDRLLPGLSVARVRYDVGTDNAPIDYVHWCDFRWSPARTWAEVRWVAFCAYMTKDQATKRFGDKIAEMLTYSTSPYTEKERNQDRKREQQSKAAVWEIWDKSNKRVAWYSKGCPQLLDCKPDILGLLGFWPCPMPMCANVTTDDWMPRPDYLFAQDLYNEIDVLETRIVILTTAVKAVGVYDSKNADVKRIFQEGMDNDLIPVDNWALFAEKGGLKGAIDWVPIVDIVNAITQLVAMRNDAIQMLYQSTGLSDVLRGAGDPNTSATQDKLKSQYASVRIQALQDEFSRFASDLMAIKAEIISKFVSPENIIKRSNIMLSYDADKAAQAIQLIKDESALSWRVEVKPESVAMVDYAALRVERNEFIQSLGFFFQSVGPLMEGNPATTAVMLEMLRWNMAAFKGAQSIESVLDRAIQQVQTAAAQPPPPPPPNPKIEEIRAKFEGELSLAEKKANLELTKFRETLMAELRKDREELLLTLEEERIAQQIELAGDLKKIVAQALADIKVNAAKSANKESEIRTAAAVAPEPSTQGDEK